MSSGEACLKFAVAVSKALVYKAGSEMEEDENHCDASRDSNGSKPRAATWVGTMVVWIYDSKVFRAVSQGSIGSNGTRGGRLGGGNILDKAFLLTAAFLLERLDSLLRDETRPFCSEDLRDIFPEGAPWPRSGDVSAWCNELSSARCG